jgi:hypothetical protein
LEYRRYRIASPAVVVAFDMCSSSNIIEELTLNGDVERLKDFLGKLKEYLAKEQKKVPFEPYKFTGDGWILLFPADTDGIALSIFLMDLCQFYAKVYRKILKPYLANLPPVAGLTFGIDKGPIEHLIMYGQSEYVGRTINIACRLQGAVKDKGGTPAYKALVSNAVHAEYFKKAAFPKVFRARRVLRNINRGDTYHCRKIELVDRNNK